jgi:hypothetical protein
LFHFFSNILEATIRLTISSVAAPNQVVLFDQQSEHTDRADRYAVNCSAMFDRFFD